MHLRLIVVVALMAIVASCTRPPTVQPSTPPVAAKMMPIVPGIMPETDITAEVDRLRQALAREVPKRIKPDDNNDSKWIAAAKAEMAASGVAIDRPQAIVVVDRNPAVQSLRIIVVDPVGPWRVVGGDKVSTGQSGRRGYFITPTGVFMHTDAIIDYRALGTFNENGIRGLGLKGMRVWDFGWQSAEPGWGMDRDPREIRLLLHATDPDFLEQRLGRPASQGCVRVSAAMNRFLDVHGILDGTYENAAHADARILTVLLPGRTPTPLAGAMMVIIDSARR